MSDGSNFPNPDSDRDMLLIGAVFVVLGAWLWATYASPWRWAGLAALLLGLAGIVAVIKRRRRGTRDDFEAPSPLPTEVALQPVAKPFSKTPVLDRADAVELSPEGRAQLEVMLDLLHEAGVLAPERPAAEHLAEAMADRGEPVTLQDLPAALEEAVAWWPEFELSRYTRNLAFHSEQVEQHEEALVAQIDDLARLSGGALDVRELDMGAVDKRHGAGALARAGRRGRNGGAHRRGVLEQSAQPAHVPAPRRSSAYRRCAAQTGGSVQRTRPVDHQLCHADDRPRRAESRAGRER